jgi:hypothetical protein
MKQNIRGLNSKQAQANAWFFGETRYTIVVLLEVLQPGQYTNWGSDPSWTGTKRQFMLIGFVDNYIHHSPNCCWILAGSGGSLVRVPIGKFIVGFFSIQSLVESPTNKTQLNLIFQEASNWWLSTVLSRDYSFNDKKVKLLWQKITI